jgi:LCP family protein required for cell wall assembly
MQPPLESIAPAPVYTPRQNWAFVLFALMAVSLTVLFGVIAMVGIRLISNGRTTAGAAGPTETAVVQSEPTAILPTPTIGLEIQPWNGNERFTILLMGLDKRPNEDGTAFRTDSMILVSIDPLTNSVGMLSIPRDLYIEIPPDTVVGSGYGLQRVNSAYVIGELARPGYGPQLAMQTVQYNLGIRVNDYFVFDFNTVIDGINAIGGIDVDVTEAINDPDYPSMNYGYEPLYIPSGRIHMDGALALKYARSRHNSSDVDRARRQQQVIMTVRAKILNLNMLPELVVQAPGLWSNLSRNIRAGLSFDQLLQLAVYLKDVPKENVRQGVIDYRYVIPTNWDGASVLIPNRESLGSLMVEVFGAGYNR